MPKAMLFVKGLPLVAAADHGQRQLRHSARQQRRPTTTLPDPDEGAPELPTSTRSTPYDGLSIYVDPGECSMTIRCLLPTDFTGKLFRRQVPRVASGPIELRARVHDASTLDVLQVGVTLI